MIPLIVYFVALVTLSTAQFQPQPSGRILESPNPALCAQSKSRFIHHYFYQKLSKQHEAFKIIS